MKRRRNHRPEPRMQLLGLNLTEADLAQLETEISHGRVSW
jgi:hypothetical protein